jgi:hypothetical protein
MNFVLQSEAGGGRLACHGEFCWRVMGGGEFFLALFDFSTDLATGTL